MLDVEAPQSDGCVPVPGPVLHYNPRALTTIPDVATPAKLTGPLARSTVIAAMGGLLFGFDTAVISGTTAALQSVYDLSGFWLGFTVASALIGTIVGSLIVGRPSDVYGRRRVLFAIALLYFLASALGIVLRPLMGEVIDWLGERIVLAADEVILCDTVGYGNPTEVKTLLQRVVDDVGDEAEFEEDGFS